VKRLLWVSALLLLVGCAGMKMPFSDSDHRHMRKMIKTAHTETNTDCISFSAFQKVGQELENQHINFLSSGDSAAALNRAQVVLALGKDCQERIKGLTTEEVKFQLFGSLQTIPNAEQLKYLGGVLFEFEDAITHSGLRPTFHLESVSSGPLRGLAAVYRLDSGQVLHLNYFGTDNVDKRELDWPLLEFLGLVAKQGSEAIIP
jgi:hypothetical protein